MQRMCCGTITVATTCDYSGMDICRGCVALEVKKGALVVRHKGVKRMRKVIE